MGFSYSQLESGVILAHEGGGDYAAVRAALKRHDQNLELGQVAGVWKVYYRYGGEQHQIQFMCDWRDPDGNALELSHGLVDKVKSLDRNSREKPMSADELEVKRQERLEKRREEIREGVIENTTFKHGRPVLPRSRGLARARSKSGYHDWKV